MIIEFKKIEKKVTIPTASLLELEQINLEPIILNMFKSLKHISKSQQIKPMNDYSTSEIRIYAYSEGFKSDFFCSTYSQVSPDCYLLETLN